MMSILLASKLIGIPFSNVKIHDSFWSPKLLANQEVTLEVCLDRCDETGRISNFSKAAGLQDGSFEGIYFNDSDVYKVLEGVAYSLMNNRNPELEQRADRIIDLIAASQQPDGYLNTYFTLVAHDKKWTDMEKHEDYCAGHLIEAAVAYQRATGKGKLLDVACKLADHIASIFGPGKRHWVTGHEELELALVKLYRITDEKRYLELSKWLLEERGRGHGSGGIWDNQQWGPSYCQDDAPVKEMRSISGHAVRAMYLYSGMADVAAETDDSEYVHALQRLWESVVQRNMYITGGIGSSKENEGFTGDYDLPNDTAYCETCASVGMVYWNHRMTLLTGEAKYADVVERELYNGVLAGVSLSADKFFYVNPLESNGSHHRQEWFDCSCCPTQIARFLPSIGNYIYATSGNALWINLFITCDAEFEFMGTALQVRQETRYPWSGSVELFIKATTAESYFINIRKPGWCSQTQIKINGKSVSTPESAGYIQLNRLWLAGDQISILFDMPVERNYANPNVSADAGRTAISRGPIVYCFEQCDNEMDVLSARISRDAPLSAEWCDGLMGGIMAVSAANQHEKLLTGVPYYTWDNRNPGKMQVWMNE